MATAAPMLARYPMQRFPTPSVTADDLFRRWEALASQRASWLFDWQDQIELMLPGGDDVLDYREPGQSRLDRIFDTTGMLAPQGLAQHIQGAVTNPAIEWRRFAFEDEVLAESQPSNLWLAACDKKVMASLNASNYYHASHTYYVHLGLHGTAAMSMLPMEVPGQRLPQLCFKPLSIGTYCIAENPYGRVDTLFHECWYTPRQALMQWGMQPGTRYTELAGQAQSMDTPQRFLHACFPRQMGPRRRLSNKEMPWASIYCEWETRSKVHEAGFEEFPFVVSRWETVSGRSPWGFGPGHMALPDVRVANTLKELNLEQLALWARPPLVQTGMEGVIGALNLEPYALNTESSPNAIRAMDFGGRPDLVQINLQDLQRSINDIFFINALQALPPPEAAKMTAFEIAQRIEQMQRLMGPAFARLLYEKLDPENDRIFRLLGRAGAFPFPPQEVLDAVQRNQGQLKVLYEGPLARSQRGADVRAIAEWYALGTQMAEATQQLQHWDNVDHDAAFRYAGEVGGVPKKLLVDLRDVVRMRKARAQAQLEQAQAASLREDMAAVGKVAPTMRAFAELQPDAALAA